MSTKKIRDRIGAVILKDKKLLLVTGYEETIYWTPGGKPVFLIGFSGILYGIYNKSDYHMIVVYGIEGNDYLVRDPNKHFNLKRIEKDKLIAAYHQAASSGILPKGVKK